MRIGFIGLGQMGREMARRLLDSGHDLIAWNRSPGPSEALRDHGASIAARIEETLQAEIVISMLADDHAVQAVWIEQGLVERLPPACLHLNMASIGLDLGRRLGAAHAARGCGYVAAPVFGRPEVALKGELDIVAAGAADALERCAPLFQALGRRWFKVGFEPHQANIVKIARNFMLAAIIESLGEAFALVEKNGVAPGAFLDIITATSMSAPAFRNYGRMMLERPAEPTFPLRAGSRTPLRARGPRSGPVTHARSRTRASSRACRGRC
ncbi:MAG: NAD-binding protein [Betaproteobacteria bacterium]|nr:NAD-binding protein [Betaproteobacteria bacterium]